MPLTSAIATDPQSPEHGAVPSLEPVLALVADDIVAVNQLIPRQLTSDVDLVEQIGRYIVESGGKRLRPLLVLLGARCCGYEGERHRVLAAIIEFLHTATLLHDDVVETSGLRRGRATANALWGNAPSVLVGDFLYSRAFQLMVELDNIDILAILADATNTIAEGEVMQLDRVGDCAIDERAYMEVIRCKTAMLFQAAAHTAAVLASDEADEIGALKTFGLQFGLAYQLVDDWLDYAGDTTTMGKNAGDDLAEGKLTLPLIHALAHSPRADAAFIRECLARRSAADFERVVAIVRASGSLDYTHAAAARCSAAALTSLTTLPDNEYRDAFELLTRFCVARLA
jgi:octaprenyl-diphosphate synthase